MQATVLERWGEGIMNLGRLLLLKAATGLFLKGP